MQNDPVYPVGEIIALANHKAGLEHPASEVEERLISALTPYRHGITASQLTMMMDNLEQRAARLKRQNNVAEATLLQDVTEVLEEAQGAIMEGDIRSATARAYTGQSLGGASASEARVAIHEKIPQMDAVSQPIKKGAAAEAAKGSRQWHDIGGPKTLPPDDAVSMNDLQRHWGTSTGFLKSLETYIRSSIVPEQGHWQDVTMVGQPPLADGTVIKAGYYTAGLSAHAKLCIEGESCATTLIPVLKEVQQQKAEETHARKDKQSKTEHRKIYKGLSLLFDSHMVTLVRGALLREVDALPEDTAPESDGSMTIHPHGLAIRLLVESMPGGSRRLLIHPSCENAVSEFATKVRQEGLPVKALRKQSDRMTPKPPVTKKEVLPDTPPTQKVFDGCWQALEAYANANDMGADGITSFIASGPKEAINLDAEALSQKCAAALKMLSQVGMDDTEAQTLTEDLIAAHANHHAARERSGKRMQ